MLLKHISSYLIICFTLFPILLHAEVYPADSPPQNFYAISGEIQAVPLTWSMHPNTKVSGYVIYRSDSIGSDFKEIVKLPSRYITSYLDGKEAARITFKILARLQNSLHNNKNYYYKIAAITEQDRIGNFSETIKVTTALRPSPPLNFKAFSGAAGLIALNWLPSNDKTVTEYRIYRKSNKEEELLSVKKISGRLTLSYVDEGEMEIPLESGHVYYYAISSINQADIESYITKIIYAETKSVPPPIEGITVSRRSIKNIEVTWDPSPIPDLKHYVIVKKRIDSFESHKEIKVSPDITKYIDESLPDGARYHYQVKAVDIDGLESLPSLAASGTTKNLPETPNNLSISMSDNNIIVRWDKNSEADIIKYEVYKMTGFLGVMKKLGITRNNSFIDRAIKRGERVSYRIVAVDEDNLKSKKSDVISIRVPK